MEINRLNIFELVNRCSVKPDKDYGQNFLVEPEIANKICSFLYLNKSDSVLEIGPGLGSLTHFLTGSCNLTVCDIDSRMIDFLKIFYKDEVTYVLNDIRKVDVSKFDKIIGNLPYNITTELVTFLLMNAREAKQMVLMCQLEAYNRFSDLSGENYGPAVVFSFNKKEDANYEEAIGTYKLAKSLFLNRRKTIYNNLKNYFGDASKAESLLKELDVNPMDRPENISPSVYLKMYQLIQNKL